MQAFDPNLKEAMAEIRAVCRKHDIGGYFALVSTTHSEFGLEIDPTWSGAHWEDKNAGKLRFKIKENELGKEKAHRMAELTCHLIFQIRDLCGQGFMFAEKMTELIKTQIEVDHTPFHGFEPHKEQ